MANFLLYLAAVTVLVFTPGPTMLMCATNAMNHGPARALASAAGANTASFGIMALSALGLGAVLAASATAFTLLKVAGAMYLVYLGVRTFRSREPLQAAAAPRVRSMFLQGVIVGASNPKAILFFAAFFPQFIDPQAPVLPQFLMLALTYVGVDLLMLVGCAFGVGRIAPRLREPRIVRAVNRVCGGLFALLGGLLLATRRAA